MPSPQHENLNTPSSCPPRVQRVPFRHRGKRRDRRKWNGVAALPSWLFDPAIYPTLKPVVVKVVAFIAHCEGRQGAFPSRTTIMRVCKISRTTLRKVIRTIRKLSLAEDTKQRKSRGIVVWKMVRKPRGPGSEIDPSPVATGVKIQPQNQGQKLTPVPGSEIDPEKRSLKKPSPAKPPPESSGNGNALTRAQGGARGLVESPSRDIAAREEYPPDFATFLSAYNNKFKVNYIPSSRRAARYQSLRERWSEQQMLGAIPRAREKFDKGFENAARLDWLLDDEAMEECVNAPRREWLPLGGGIPSAYLRTGKDKEIWLEGRYKNVKVYGPGGTLVSGPQCNGSEGG